MWSVNKISCGWLLTLIMVGFFAMQNLKKFSLVRFSNLFFHEFYIIKSFSIIRLKFFSLYLLIHFSYMKYNLKTSYILHFLAVCNGCSSPAPVCQKYEQSRDKIWYRITLRVLPYWLYIKTDDDNSLWTGPRQVKPLSPHISM